MNLEILDKTDDPIVGRIKNIEYDYMAEMWVQDIYNEERTKRNLDKFVLKDSLGVRAIWQIYPDGVAIVEKSERYQGEWEINLKFAGNNVHSLD